MNELVVTLKALEIAHTDHNHCVPPVSALQKKHSRGISSASYNNLHLHALPKLRVWNVKVYRFKYLSCLFSFSHRNSLQHPKRTITYMNEEKYSYLLKIIIRKIRMVTEICSSVGKWTGSSAEIHSFPGYVSGISSVVSLPIWSAIFFC